MTELGPGARINGNYELLRELGSGGMARVWLATHVRTGDRRAIKFPIGGRERETVRGMFATRLQQEFGLLRSLSHEHLIRVTEMDEWQSIPYFVMEFIDGVPLNQWLKDRLDVRRAADLLRPLASVLDYVHQKGIVHRDVSPQNVLVGEEGRRVTLIDFGIAVGADLTDTQNTEHPSFFGKLRYSAPEQVKGFSVVDARADVFAMAAVSLEVLSGQRFDRASAELEAQFERAALPAALGLAIRRALSESPSERPATVGEFFEAFEQGVRDQAIVPERRSSQLASHGLLPTALSLVAGLSLAVAGVGWTQWAEFRSNRRDESGKAAASATPVPPQRPLHRELAATCAPTGSVAAPSPLRGPELTTADPEVGVGHVSSTSTVPIAPRSVTASSAKPSSRSGTPTPSSESLQSSPSGFRNPALPPVKPAQAQQPEPAAPQRQAPVPSLGALSRRVDPQLGNL